MIGTLDPTDKAKWQQWVPTLTHAYNCTRCESTGFSPYYLMYGLFFFYVKSNAKESHSKACKMGTSERAHELLIPRLSNAFHVYPSISNMG